MAELPSDEDNELNFSDYEANSDSDGDDPPPPPPKPTSVIAHKEMKTVPISDAEDSDKDDSDKDDSDAEDSDKEDSPQDLEFETISPAGSPVHASNSGDVSDEENTDTERKLISTVISTHSSGDFGKESASEPEKPTFEAISPVSEHGNNSPVSEHGNNFEAISPPGSPMNISQNITDTKPQFENISDDEEEVVKKPEEIPEGKFSPVPGSDNELNFHDESSNDSGYQIIQPVKKTPLQNNKDHDEEDRDDVENEQESDEEVEKPPEDNEVADEVGDEVGDEVDDDDIEAPMPSPFSDIGDLDDMMDADGQIICDILKDTDATEKQFEFDLGLPPNKLTETVEETDNADVTEDEEILRKNKDDSSRIENEEIETHINNVSRVNKENESKSENEDGIKGRLEEREKDDADDEDDDDNDDDDDADGKNRTEKDATVSSGDEDETNDASQESVVNEEGDTVTGKSEVAGSPGEEGKKDDEEEGEDAGDLIADIFGDSDDEEEFEGFADEEIPEGEEDKAKSSDDEVEPVQVSARPVRGEERESDDEEPRDVMPARDFVNDFDLMMETKRERARAARRKRKDCDVIGDNDEIIASMIRKMKTSAEEDRMLNQAGKAATKKLKMLETVGKHLRKNDLQMTLIDCGVLGAMKEWLTPLPDHALPHIHIRQKFLKILTEFPTLDKSALKQSGIGRAVMLLFKHPKETRENKFIAGKLISAWARPIFNVSTNFLDMTKEEREERDKKTLENKKRSKEEREDMEPKRTKLEEEDNENKPRKPGDKGWCARARVPQASSRDYVNRPASKLDPYEQSRQLNTKKPLNRYEKHALKMKGKRGNKVKAMDISLSGSKMGL